MQPPARALVLAAALLAPLTGTATAHAARTATVGPGFAAGVAVAADGTAYVGWKTESGAEPSVRLCALARNARGCSTPPAAVPIPGPYNLGDVGVFTPAPGVVEVVAGSTSGAERDAFLSRSTDGGRSFAPAVRLVPTNFAQRFERLPDGRIGIAAGANTLEGGAVAADGSGSGSRVVELSSGVSGVGGADVAGTPEGATVVAGSTEKVSEAFLLPPGADPANRAGWAALPRQAGTDVRLSGGPAGLFAALSSFPARRHMVQRLEGSAWTRPVTVGGSASGVDVVQDAAARVHVFATNSPAGTGEVTYARSDDGGALWSASTRLAPVRRTSSEVGAAVGPDGRGAVVEWTASGDEPIRVAWFEPARVPAATVTVGDAFVQVRSRCARGREVAVEARASRGGRRVATSSVLRSARYSSRRGPVRRERRFAARLRLRSAKASAPVRATLRPRSGGAPVAATFRAVGCRGTQ